MLLTRWENFRRLKMFMKLNSLSLIASHLPLAFGKTGVFGYHTNIQHSAASSNECKIRRFIGSKWSFWGSIRLKKRRGHHTAELWNRIDRDRDGYHKQKDCIAMRSLLDSLVCNTFMTTLDLPIHEISDFPKGM